MLFSENALIDSIPTCVKISVNLCPHDILAVLTKQNHATSMKEACVLGMCCVLCYVPNKRQLELHHLENRPNFLPPRKKEGKRHQIESNQETEKNGLSKQHM